MEGVGVEGVKEEEAEEEDEEESRSSPAGDSSLGLVENA